MSGQNGSNESIILLEWTTPMNESIVAFNIYRAEISDKSKESNLKELTFINIGSTEKLSFIDELERIEIGTSKDFYYYISSLSNDGTELGKSNLTKVTVSVRNPETRKTKMETINYVWQSQNNMHEDWMQNEFAELNLAIIAVY